MPSMSSLTSLAQRAFPPVVPVIRLDGVIGRAGGVRRGLTLDSVAPLIERAFAARRAPCVALIVNSPGGTPVQAGLIAGRIRALAAEKQRKVVAFVEDVAASGGYMIACAADEIVAHGDSVVGSIGVVSAGFGLTGLIERIGVERRLHATGPNKAMLDPFQPEDPAHVRRLETLLGDIHRSFSDLVRERRGDRLKGDPAELFSGAFWTGRTALAMGLVDAIGEPRTVLRARYGERVRFRVMAPRRSWLSRRLGATLGLDALPGEALATLEERAAWARFGL